MPESPETHLLDDMTKRETSLMNEKLQYTTTTTIHKLLLHLPHFMSSELPRYVGVGYACQGTYPNSCLFFMSPLP
jgi:hypothetical protein